MCLEFSFVEAWAIKYRLGKNLVLLLKHRTFYSRLGYHHEKGPSRKRKEF
jgi:predicted N-acetyltransferase YhbS